MMSCRENHLTESNWTIYYFGEETQETVVRWRCRDDDDQNSIRIKRFRFHLLAVSLKNISS